MIGTKKIMASDRLFLRELAEEDLDALYAVLGDREIMCHYPWAFDREKVQEWIKRNISRYRELGFGLWAVCLKETGELIGDCGLSLQPIGGEMLPEIGYHIRRDCQRKGYAREAAAMARDRAFEHTAYNALYSCCKYTNEPSYRTAESIGMRFLKEYPDEVNEVTHVSFMTREDWLGMKRESIRIVRADRTNFREDSLDFFERYQEVRRCYRTEGGKLVLRDIAFTEDWPPEERRKKAERIMNGKYITFCALDGSRIVGAILLDPELEHGRMIVESFHVTRGFRRCGIGRRLFDAAMEEARGRGAKALYISACSAEETVNFYTAMGCRSSESPIPAYAESEPCDIQMERAL